MKVKELISCLQNIDPELEVVVSCFSHSYTNLLDKPQEVKAGYDGRSDEMYELWDDEDIINETDKIIKVCLLGRG